MRRSILLVTLAALATLAGRAGAQPVTVSASAPLLGAPSGRTVGTLRAGAAVARGATRGGFTQVTVEGWVESAALRSARGGQWTHIVRAASGTTLRSEPSAGAAAVAQLPRDMGLTLVARRGDWVQVRRPGWVASSRLTRTAQPPTAAASRPAATPARGAANPATAGGPPRNQGAPAAPTARNQADADSTQASPPPGALTPGRETILRAAPESDRTLGTLTAASILEPVARDRGWVKVRVEGWVRESDVVAADTSLRASTLTAADLRADPAGTKGRVVRWEVEFLAFRTADPLRPELANGEPYILARGPGGENALLYLALPAPLVAEARALQPLASLTVTARVRSGRGEPVGVPVLEILTLSRR